MSQKKISLEEAARQALAVTLENMAFEEVFLLDKAPEQMFEMSTGIWTRLDILTPIKGKMAITICPSCAERLVKTILGPMVDEDNIEPAMVKDTVGELINTVAGRFMNLIVDKGEDFTIGLPEAGEGIAIDEKKVYRHIYFRVSDDHMVVTLGGDQFRKFDTKQSLAEEE